MKINVNPLNELRMNRRLLLTFFVTLTLICSSCRNSKHGLNVRNSDVKITIQRFDQELFMMNTDTLPASISWLYKKYDDFLDVFSYHVIGIGSPSGRDYQAYLSMFLNDRLNREVYQETQRIFPDLHDLEKKLSGAFGIFQNAFPEKEIPMVVTYVSRFNNPCFTVSNYIGIGLDRYLGKSSVYYKKLELSEYAKLNMFPDKIPSDLMYVWASATFPFNDSSDNVLARMIHEGKLMFFAETMLPKEPDSLIIGFTKNQMKWVRGNEAQMWTYLVEKKLLFSRDAMDIRKLTGAAPFTYYFSNESPGRAGVYIGWRIFREYATRNPKLSFSELMDEKDYEKILRLSKYNP
jgi:hypothetical protein